MRPFAIALLACCTCAFGSAEGQMVCGPNGCYSVGASRSGFFGRSVYRTRAVTTSPMLTTSSGYVASSTPVLSSVVSTSPTTTYGVADDGRVVAANGDTVKSIGGVEVVSRDWALARIAKAEDAAMSYASIPEGCNCKDYSEQLDRIEANQAEILKRLPYREQQQSKADREFAELVAQQAADRAVVMGRQLAQR